MCLLIYAPAAIMAGAAWTIGNVPAAAALLAGAVLMAALAASFHYLRVMDEGDRLTIAFGPVPLFRRSVRYADIERVDIGRTTLLDGWGIHLSLRGGWVWNIWGRDCVVLDLRKGTLRVGSDDAEGLSRFLRERVGNE